MSCKGFDEFIDNLVASAMVHRDDEVYIRNILRTMYRTSLSIMKDYVYYDK